MNLQKIKKGIIKNGLFILFLISAFEITAYFLFIYKPASRIFGQNSLYPLEIPALSQILKPSQITDETISLADTPKNLFPEQLLRFTKLLDVKLLDQNTFVKESVVSMITEGEVSNVKKATDRSITLTLKNSTTSIATEYFPAQELTDMKVSLIILSPSSPSRVDAKLEDAKVGDTLIIKTSTSILTNSASLTREVEIIRQSP